MTDYSRRDFVRNTAVLGGSVVFLGACTSAPQPKGGTGTAAGGPALGKLEGAELVTDAAAMPKAFKESPEFAKLVAEGKLPPVAERIGKPPLVLKPLHGVGKYGGQIRRGASIADVNNGALFCAGPDSLLYWHRGFENVVPNVVRAFELSDNDRVLTLHLREGMKWSDGTPFTADDILFWRDDVSLNPDLGDGSPTLQIASKDVQVKKVDSLTVQYISPVPNPLLPARMAGLSDISGMAFSAHLGGGGYLPKHYLSKFLPKYSGEAGATKLAKQAGFNGWAPYFKDRASWHLNTDLPVLSPWRTTRSSNTPPWVLQANPYSIWVDNEGNQLPYIPQISMRNVENVEVLGLQAAAGDYDFQDRGLQVTNLPVLLENEEKGGYKVHRTPRKLMDCGVRINLAYVQDREIGDLLRTADFRRALSLGVDRKQINEAFLLGMSIPSATMVADDSPYFPGPEWRTKWATHDIQQANGLLDKIGLTAKDTGGFRLRRDGKGRIRLEIEVTKSHMDFPGVAEMLKRQWQPLGIDVIVQVSDLLVDRALANRLMLSVHTVGTEDPFLVPDTLLPTVTNNYPGMIGIPYAKWFTSGGRAGTEPPQEVGLLKTAMAMYNKGLSAPKDQRIQLGKELYKMHADQVWSIGIAGFGISQYGVYLASNKLRNVPERILSSIQLKSPSNAYPMTFSY